MEAVNVCLIETLLSLKLVAHLEDTLQEELVIQQALQILLPVLVCYWCERLLKSSLLWFWQVRLS